MSYYRGGDNYNRGDYYRGDYYRGGDFLGAISRAARGVASVAGTVARTATSLGLGGPLVSAFGRATNPGALPTMRPGSAPVSLNDYGSGGLMVPSGPAFRGTPATAVVGPQGQTIGGTGMGAYGQTKAGYHLNRAGYFRRTPGGGVIWVEAHSALVRNRHMNATNGRALTKALRRAVAFKKVAMKAIRLVDAGRAKKKFAGFKTTRRKRA